MAKKGKRRCDTLPILHPDAAGRDHPHIDLTLLRQSQPGNNTRITGRRWHAVLCGGVYACVAVPLGNPARS
jgi:hypothetical protein